ncbi:MAG: 50S ribosomal protein L18 [SAR202 cluster bacterium]|nr:50S ribosomal protein L18 [SAR202 cluster bacterium]
MRHRRVRKRVFGTPARPRLSVFRSNQHIYAQVIDDEAGKTLAAASTADGEMKPTVEKTKKTDAAARVGAVLAQRARAAGVSAVIFDRGGFKYHGRVKALADAARKEGLDF